jgi:hypothetical protein
VLLVVRLSYRATRSVLGWLIDHQLGPIATGRSRGPALPGGQHHAAVRREPTAIEGDLGPRYRWQFEWQRDILARSLRYFAPGNQIMPHIRGSDHIRLRALADEVIE